MAEAVPPQKVEEDEENLTHRPKLVWHGGRTGEVEVEISNGKNIFFYPIIPKMHVMMLYGVKMYLFSLIL